MSFRRFVVLSACLLGACERKDAVTEATLPDHAEMRSGLRDSERRAVVTRREREGKSDAVEVIRRLASQGNNPGNLYREAGLAIQEADPTEFEAIWRALDEVKIDVVMNLQVMAIYRLASKEDLAAAGRMAREILLPRYPEEQRLEVLKELMRLGEDGSKLASFLEFMRGALPEERQWLKKEMGTGWILPEHLTQLAGSSQRLNTEETRLILETYAICPIGDIHVIFGPTEPRVKDIYQKLWDTVKDGEGKGVFAKGAGDIFLNVAGIYNGDWYLEMVPLEKLGSVLMLEGGDRTVEGIILKDIGRQWSKGELPEHWVPTTFFTPSGVRHLPQEKVSTAIAIWNQYCSDDAEAWFTHNSGHLTIEQRNLALAEFSENDAYRSDLPSKAKSQAWLDQISDPELRERTVREIERKLSD